MIQKIKNLFKQPSTKVLNMPIKPLTTLEAWQKQENEKREKYPIRYFLFTVCKNKIKNAFYRTERKYFDIVSYIQYRWVTPYNVVKTNLKHGFYEGDVRAMNAMFTLLVDFVEIELELILNGNMNQYIPKIFKRNPEHGLKNLKLLIMENPQEKDLWVILDLYVWWKFVRPMRPSALELSGLNEFKKNNYNPKNRTEFGKYVQLYSNYLKVFDDIELDYYNQDTEQLMRLMQHRKYLRDFYNF